MRLLLARLMGSLEARNSPQHHPIGVACMAVVKLPLFTVRMRKRKSAPLEYGVQHIRIVRRRCDWGCSWSQNIHEWNMHQDIPCVKDAKRGCDSTCMHSPRRSW